MIFLVTTDFRNTHPALSDAITRVGGSPLTHEFQYDSGEFVSIGQDDRGQEMTPAMLVKAGKGHKAVQLIGHLNHGGRLLDPFTQRLECSQALGEASARLRKQYKALITSKNILDPDLEKVEIAEYSARIKSVQARSQVLAKMAADIHPDNKDPQAVQKLVDAAKTPLKAAA